MSSKFWAELSSDYEKLFETEIGYDVVIYAGEEPNVKEIHAHSNILCIRSKYFRTAFSNEWAEKKDGKFILRKPNISPHLFNIILSPMKKQCLEYVPNMSRKCTKIIMYTFGTYSGYPSVRNMFQNVIVSGHSFCPEYIIVLDFSKLLLYWTVYGHFQDIFLIFSGHMFFFRTFSGHFQARIYLTRARIYQLTQARIKNQIYTQCHKYIQYQFNLY
jgi:hypothetical protein